MEYFSYVLLSQTNGFIYVGSTRDVKVRLKKHNAGKVKSTKTYRPWKLLEFYKFSSRSEAVKHERFLKTHQQKDLIKKRYDLK
jgi:putative endonuclease